MATFIVLYAYCLCEFVCESVNIEAVTSSISCCMYFSLIIALAVEREMAFCFASHHQYTSMGI